MKTVIIGASDKTDRYSYQAASMLQNENIEFVPLALHEGIVLGVTILPIYSYPIIENVHTVTLYINPAKSNELADYILSLNPKRIIFNPGTENPLLLDRATANNIECMEACTLVLLATKQF